jgi:tetraacyldisaccharide 4'-kinase
MPSTKRSGAPAPALEQALTRAWLGRGLLACALWPVSLLFSLVSSTRAALFRCGVLSSQRMPVPVIVVGNIFIGGTGKTPLTIWLVEALRAAGMRPGVISRGHGGAARGPCALTPASTPQQVGDEPLLIAQRAQCPVVVGRDRVAAARLLLAQYPEVDVLVSDDGLQHYRLQRDVELILFDARGAGNGWLLPAGPLREARSRRRDFTVINAIEVTPALRADVGGAPFQMLLGGHCAERLTGRAGRIELGTLAAGGQRIVAAAGIGNPGRFFAMLRAAGLRFAELPLPDHHDFLDHPFDAVEADIILITEKDAVKCAQLENLNNDPRLWVVPVTAQLDGALAQQIVEKCRGRSPA